MADRTPRQTAAAVARWAAGLPRVVEGELRAASARIGGRAVGTYMRDAKGQGRRSKGDRGPLRIVRGTLAGAVGATGRGFNRPGAVNEVTTTGDRVTLTKGVDLSAVPYARVHEEGHGATPARPYLGPALRDETPGIRRSLERTVTRSLREAL